MSENHLIVIPNDPRWVPNEDQGAAGIEALRRLAPRSDEVAAQHHSAVQFIDQGSNFERVSCPNCGTEIEIPAWHEMMAEARGPDVDGEPAFADLSCVMRCCAVATTLNDLTYSFPAGFATFEIHARNPDRQWLNAAEMEVVENALGHSCRQIFRHS